MTNVASSFFAGAEMMTFLAPPSMCALAFAASVKMPVDSTTMSAPASPQAMAAGSFSAKTLIVVPPTVMESSVAETSSLRTPRTESYFRRCAIVVLSMRSLAATISMSAPDACTARKKFRPIRPKPLIPTRTVTVVLPSTQRAVPRDRDTLDSVPTLDPGRWRSSAVRGVGRPPWDAAISRPACRPSARPRCSGCRRPRHACRPWRGAGGCVRRRHPWSSAGGGAQAAPPGGAPFAYEGAGPRGPAEVGVVEVREAVRRRPHLAADAALLPREDGVVGAEPGEHGTDGVAVTDDDTVDATDLASLGGDVEAARCADEGERGLGAGAGHLERRRAARLGERSVGEEGAAPCALGVADGSADDLRRQSSHGATTAVDEPGLPRQGLSVLDDADHVTAALAQATGGEHEDLRCVSVDLRELAAQPTRGVRGVELGLDDDAATDDVQAAGEPQGGGDLGLAAARLGDLVPAQFVLHLRRHRHGGHPATRHRTPLPMLMMSRRAAAKRSGSCSPGRSRRATGATWRVAPRRRECSARRLSSSTTAGSTSTPSSRSRGARVAKVSRCRSALKPAVSPDPGSRLRTRRRRARVTSRASRTSGTRRWVITDVNHDPGPRTAQSAPRMAATDSG